MQGLIVDIKVEAGQKVKTGDEIVILEAMKMENPIVAPKDGTISAIKVSKGDSVNSDDILAISKNKHKIAFLVDFLEFYHLFSSFFKKEILI